VAPDPELQPGPVRTGLRPAPTDIPVGLTDPKKLAAWQKDLVSYL